RSRMPSSTPANTTSSTLAACHASSNTIAANAAMATTATTRPVNPSAARSACAIERLVKSVARAPAPIGGVQVFGLLAFDVRQALEDRGAPRLLEVRVRDHADAVEPSLAERTHGFDDA